MNNIKMFEEYDEFDYDAYDEENEPTKVNVENDYGYALGEIDSDGYCEMKIVHVMPEHQGKGHGRKLVRLFLEEVKDLNMTNKVHIEVEAVHNARIETDELYGFYESLGFVRGSRNMMYYDLYKKNR